MARQRQPLVLNAEKARQDREFLEAMAADEASDDRTRKRARLILAMLGGASLEVAAAQVELTVATAKDKLRQFNEGGWKALLTVQAPRGGDFLARYDQGFWAERLTRACLDQSRDYRAIPYGTSRSEPFTDMQTFRQYMETEFLLQAWSARGHWKRPDLLLIPRAFLREQKGNDSWTPDLQHLDNQHCQPYVEQAAAAIEVETSLWLVQRARQARVRLSFTVKEEDLESLRNWVRANRKVPLFIVQVFYDEAYALPFATLEQLFALPKTNPRRVVGVKDKVTQKVTYKVPLDEGVLLGTITEPDVEGRVFKAPNGKVTVYGRLVGSAISVSDPVVLGRLVSGTLEGARPLPVSEAGQAAGGSKRGQGRRKGGKK
jgi:hypothetical protein